MKVLNKNDGYDYGLVEKVFDTVLPQDLSNELAIYDTTEDAPVLAACVLDKLKTKDNSKKFVI